MALEQGYPVIRLLDSNNVKVLSVPSYGGGIGTDTFGQITQTARLAVTSAQLLALRATPLIIAPALAPLTPQPNMILVPTLISMHYIFGTAAYTINAGTLRLTYGPVVNANYLCADQSALIGNTANRVNPNIAITAVGAVTEANGLNQAIYLVNGGAAEFTVGAGTLVVGVTFNMFNL